MSSQSTKDKSSHSDSLPTPPKEHPTFLPKQPLPPSVDINNVQPIVIQDNPSTWAFIKGHTKYCIKSSIQFIFKDNNLPLLVNMIYHLIAARALMARPWKTTHRYIYIASPLGSSSKSLRYQIEQTTAIAVDTFRALGVMHLALGVLSALALKERRQSSERSALVVLTLASLGNAWAHMNAYWQKTGSQYTLKAIQEVGSSNLFVLVISSIALSKTIKRTGRFI